MSGLSYVIWNLFGSYTKFALESKFNIIFFNISSNKSNYPSTGVCPFIYWIDLTEYLKHNQKPNWFHMTCVLWKASSKKVQFVVRTKRNDINEKNDSLYGQWKYVIQFTCKLGSRLMKAVNCCFYFWICLNLFLNRKVFHALSKIHCRQ